MIVSDKNVDSWKFFLKICVELKTANELEGFFRFILTHGEREDIAHRIRIVKELLLEEKTQREIAASTGVSIAKITRGSNQLKDADVKLKNFLKSKL
ncbi:MAG: trp operon repressor [Gammaproteobacteria bacterium]|nr:trp operon repressor [Gammaproteobacteria bacterium]